MTERIDIELTSKVDAGINPALKAIATNSREAGTAILELQRGLKNLNAAELIRVTSAVNNAATALRQQTQQLNAAAAAQNTAALSASRLATEQQRQATAAAAAATAQQRTLAASANASQAQTRANDAAAASQDRSALAAVRLQAAQQRAAAAVSAASAAADRAALTAMRLEQAQDRQAKAAERAAGGMKRYVSAAAGAVAGALGAREIIQTADAYTTLQNKLQNVSTSQEQVNQLTERLFDLAVDTRSSVDATATSFARFDRALKYMGKSQEETLRMTETINKALIVGGSTANEAASALLQLSQAFNAGKLQGDEFRAISEAMPSVLDAVAKVMEKPISQVKKLSTEGKITAEVMYKAFESMRVNIDSVFAKTIPTVSQALEVLNTRWTRFVGEIDKSLGASAALAQLIMYLSQNLDALAVVAATAGAALLVSFGPSLAGMLVTATRAMIGFNVALAANPIGLLVVGIAAATAAIVTFGDKITIVEDKGITLKDMFRTAFSFISEGARTAGTFLNEYIAAGLDAIGVKTQGFGEIFSRMLSGTLTVLKAWGNQSIGIWVSMINTAKIIWDTFPVMIKGAFETAVSIVKNAMARIINSIVGVMEDASTVIAKFAPDTAKALNESLAGMKVEVPKIEVSKAGALAAKELTEAMQSGFKTDYLGNIGDAFMSRAAEIAKKRQEDAKKQDMLRGSGSDTTGSGLDDGKSAEKRATAMAKVNLQLDNELERLNQLQPVREAQQRFDQIEEQLAGRKIKLNADEAKSIKDKIDKLQQAQYVQSAMDAQYNAAVGPLRDYNAAVQASGMLLAKNVISQQQHLGNLAGAKELYENATDPLRKYTQEMDFEATMLGMNNKQREISIQMRQIEQELLGKNVVLTDAQTAALRKQAEAAQRAQSVQAEYNNIYDSTKGQLETIQLRTEALTMAYQNGVIGMAAYQSQMVQLGTQAAQLRIAMDQALPGDAFTASFGRLLEGYQGMLAGTTAALGDMFVSIQDGFANALAGAIMGTEDLGEALRNVATNAVQMLLSSLIKLGIQYAINAAIGQTIGAASVAASIGMGTATAVAWAPAAAAVSLATLGTNGPPAVAAISAANVASTSFALAGFQQGGYTGNGAVDQVMGVVHGGEYVMTADTVSRLGIDTMEQIQSGRPLSAPASGSLGVQQPASVGMPRVSVTIINNVDGAKATTTQRQDESGNTDIRVQLDSIENGLAARLDSGQGPLHKSMAKNFDLQPATIKR